MQLGGDEVYRVQHAGIDILLALADISREVGKYEFVHSELQAG